MATRIQQMQTPDQSISHLPSRISFDSQDPQWKKLEIKYKEYIKLLKKKIGQLETKQSTITKASLSVSNSQPLCSKIQKLLQQRLRQSFNQIIIHSSLSSKQQPKTKDNFKIPHMKIGLRILDDLLMKQRLKYFQYLRNNDSQQYKVLKSLERILESKIHNSKILGFIGIKVHKLKQNQKVKQLTYVKEILQNVSLDTTVDYNTSFYLLKKQNTVLKTELQEIKYHSQESKRINALKLLNETNELNKKQKYIGQLIEQIGQKDRIIHQYELQIQTYRGLKGKSKCSPDCNIQKKKLNNYYQKALSQVKIKKELIADWQNKYNQLLNEYNKIRKTQQQQILSLKQEIQNLKSDELELDYKKYLQITRIDHVNKRMKIADDKEHIFMTNQKQMQTIKQTIIKINAICRLHNQTELNKIQEIIKIIDITNKNKQKQSQHSSSPLTPSQVITLIQKMLSQDQMKLDDYPNIPKVEHQRLELIQTSIFQMKNLLMKKEKRIAKHQEQVDQMLIVKPTEQRGNNLLAKVIDLETQKIKDEQFIFSLKKKFLDARQTVLSCLDSLAVKNISNQGEVKLEQLFDLFEYTDQERELVLLANNKNKQKFFKWI